MMDIDLSTLTPRSILVCQLKQIGDVVISTAMVELLARRYPEAEIHFLTEARSAPILENNPHLTQVWQVDKTRNPLADFAFTRRVARHGFDLLVDFQQLPRTRRIAILSPAPVRLSIRSKWYKQFPYTHLVEMRKGGYAGRFKAQLLAPLGIQWETQPPRMYLSEAERAWAALYLTSQGFTSDNLLVTMDPTHWSDTRCWPAHHFSAFITQAIEARPELLFYLFHGPGERDQVEQVVRLSGRADRCILPPDTEPSLRQTAAIIDRADIQIGNCSAPRHMAVALHTPTLTIVGSNGDTAWTFPDKARHRIAFHYLPCSKCNRNTCQKGTLECLHDLTPAKVTTLFLELLHDTHDQHPR